MSPEFDDEDDSKPLRVLASRPAPQAETTPAKQLIEVLRQIPPLLSALLSRTPVINIAPPVIHVPPAQVQVTVPERPRRTVTCHIERDDEGRAQRITFTED